MTKNPYIHSPLNYTGGKHRLLPQLIPLFPQTPIRAFVDLFCGACNVSLNVHAQTIVCNDTDKNIVDILQSFKGYEFNTLYKWIGEIISKYQLSKENSDGFLRLRDYYNEIKVNYPYTEDSGDYPLPIVLYTLACYSFNNQIRFNSNGEFNMPFGKNKSSFNKNTYNNLLKACEILQKGNYFFTNKSFTELKLSKLHENDFVYCDPPYLITCATYNEKDGWNEQDEKDLLKLLDNLSENNIKFGLSNVFSNKGKENEILIQWAEKYNVHHLNYSYSNCSYHGKNKGCITDEVLITNY
jgi:DNA adenine methylase Dam